MATTTPIAPSTDTLLHLEHVSEDYGAGARRFTAVKDINIKVNAGEFVALLGPSGCGKSTLLRIITGLQPPTEGRVMYRDAQLVGVNPHAAIVFQTFALFPWLTVLENVELALKVRGVPPAQRTSRSVELLDRVGLDGFEGAYPRELSGGMRQKVGFARAMAVEPELLCLDEPFSALDVLSAESLRGELLELWLSGKIPTRAILMVTHNIEEAVSMVDRIIVMEKGPGRVMAELAITLPHPRLHKDPAFIKVVDEVYGLLAGHTEAEAVELGSAPGEAGNVRMLPHVHVSELAGLLEYLEETPGYRFDIYSLEDELGLDSSDLLRIIEVAELLGFASVEKGDITLLPLGETFAEASILARKEIFSTRIRRLPLINWILSLLTAADRRRLKWDVVLAALELDFPRAEAEKQLDTLTNWGRYAEIFAYDDDDELFYLEQPGEDVH